MAKSKRGDGGSDRTHISPALFAPGLISRRWHSVGVVSEVACFGKLPKARTILHLAPEPDTFSLGEGWGRGYAYLRVRRCEQEVRKAELGPAKAVLNKLINTRSERQGGRKEKENIKCSLRVYALDIAVTIRGRLIRNL